MSNLLIPFQVANESAALNWQLSGQAEDADVLWDSAFSDGYKVEAGVKWEGEGDGQYASCVEARDDTQAEYDDASHPVVCSVLQMSGETATAVSVHSLSAEQWANINNAIEGPMIAGATYTNKWDEEVEEVEEVVEDEASDDAF